VSLDSSIVALNTATGAFDVPQVGIDPPTNKDQCKNGGWRNFDTPRVQGPRLFHPVRHTGKSLNSNRSVSNVKGSGGNTGAFGFT